MSSAVFKFGRKADHAMAMMTPANLSIREARAEDAAALVAYCIRLTDEPNNNISRDPGQWTMTVEQERDYLVKRYQKTEEGIYLIAEVGDQIVGSAALDRGRRLTNKHAGTLGLSVDLAWRGRGIASALMRFIVDWAKANNMVRLELNVFSRNTTAIHLYENLGFEQEGRHPFAFCKQGIWLEELTMGLILRQP